MSSANSPSDLVAENEPTSNSSIDTVSDAPPYILGRLNLPWAKQHRIVSDGGELTTACVAAEMRNVSYTIREFDSDKPQCQHQDCFGGGKLPDEEVKVVSDFTAYKQPLIRSTNDGRVHKPDVEAGLPACGVHLEKGYWVVLEGENIDESDADLCFHQDCFGSHNRENWDV